MVFEGMGASNTASITLRGSAFVSGFLLIRANSKGYTRIIGVPLEAHSGHILSNIYVSHSFGNSI